MTNEYAIEILRQKECCRECMAKCTCDECEEAFEMAIQSLTAVSELSKRLKAVNRYEMDEKVLIGFNMAVAIFNECFGEVGEKMEEE